MTKEELKPLIAIVLKQLMARECTTFKELKDKKDIDEELESALNDALTLILGYVQDEPEIYVYPTIPLPTVPQTIPQYPWYTQTITSVSTEIVNDCEVTPSDAKECYTQGYKDCKEEFEKNRLAACDSQTEEEAEREMKFTTDFIEEHHRLPTYSDIIEIVRKDIISKACEWLFSHLQHDVPTYFYGDETVTDNLERSLFIKEFRKAMTYEER